MNASKTFLHSGGPGRRSLDRLIGRRFAGPRV